MKNTLMKSALVATAFALIPAMAVAELTFYNTVTGEPLDLSHSPKEGSDTPAVKQFLETGLDPYVEVKGCLPKGQKLFLEACSGCHGQVGEGKIGPGLNDNYWTYPKNTTDKGIFETIYGGARSQMGPHWDLQLDEILLIIAWIRHLYHGPVEDAVWLTPEQQKVFVPYDPDHPVTLPDDGTCEIPAK